MDIAGRRVVILGGSGLVGMAIARRLLPFGPARLVVGGLREEEARGAVEELALEPGAGDVELVPTWGNLFLREADRERPRAELAAEATSRRALLEDLFGPLDEEAFRRTALFTLLETHRPHLVIDCVNTATAIAYQDLFGTAERLRVAAAESGEVGTADIETHLATSPLPQLIRHVQVLLEALRRAATQTYVKIGTSGTGGMGLNVPFTHSEERPSRNLLAKASVAGAHSALLFLLARTPGAPAVIEIKPSAAIAWKRIAYGPVLRGGRPIPRVDAARPIPLEEAFAAREGTAAGERTPAEADGPGSPEPPWTRTEEPIESVYLDAGENGLFSLSEFEVISALGLMEVVTPEEIAQAAIDEIRGRPTGRDVVSALDASSFGPTYRGGLLRDAALACMERLEREHGVRSVAFEMLGPPRLSKLLFEAAILERLFAGPDEAAGLDPEETASRARELIEADDRLRSDALSIGIPILMPDGEHLLRGPEVKVRPANGADDVGRWAARGWVDLRPASWVLWRERCRGYRELHLEGPGAEAGSGEDLDVRAGGGELRAGALAAFVFRIEDGGERRKR